MARRKARTKKVKPAERTLNFILTEGTHYIDLAQCLSLVNRAAYRQGMQYAIEGVELVSSLASTVQIDRVSQSWPVVNAWTKGMALWREQQNEALRDAGMMDTKGKYNDFKLTMEKNHALVTANNLIPMNCPDLAAVQAVSPTVAYEWAYSDIVVPNDAAPGNTVIYPIHWVGQDGAGAGASKSIGLAYAQSRSRPMQTDPNIVDVPMGGLFGEMQDVGDDDTDIINLAQTEGNQAPYYNDVYPSNDEFYPGGSGIDVLGTGATGITTEYFLATNTSGRLVSSFGGSSIIPAGLLRLTVGGTANLKIVIAPGAYKGVMARPMQVVN